MRHLAGCIVGLLFCVSVMGEGRTAETKEPHMLAKGPPSWAPAHGRRAQDYEDEQVVEEVVEEYYVPEEIVEETYVTEEEPYPPEDVVVETAPPMPEPRFDIVNGHCDHKSIGMLLGGAIGANIAAHRDRRGLKTLAGAVIGALVGREIGKRMDKADNHCTGQALEHAPDGKAVVWVNAATGIHYHLTPYRTYRRNGQSCRKYKIVHRHGRSVKSSRYTACRNHNGAWRRL